MKVDGKRVYDGNEFEVEQAKHRQSTVRKLRDVHNEIIQAMSKTFEASTYTLTVCFVGITVLKLATPNSSYRPSKLLAHSQFVGVEHICGFFV